MTTPGPLARRVTPRALLLLALGVLLAAPCSAQSEHSALAELSVAPSNVAASTALLALGAGGSVVVRGVRTIGTVTRVVLESLVDGTRFVLELGADGAGQASLAVGTALTVTAQAGGWLLAHGDDVVAFVPDARGRALMHHAELAR